MRNRFVLCALLLFLVVSTTTALVDANRDLQAMTPQDLWDRWRMDEPIISYDEPNNQFTLDFNTASTLNAASNMRAGVGLVPAGSGTMSGVVGPDGVSNAEMTMNGPGGRPQLIFRIKPQVFVDDADIYNFVDQALLDNDPDSIYSASDIGFGVMRFAVRCSLGYEWGPNPVFQEVNFIESLIRIKYDLTLGFNVVDFRVEPKDLEEVTAIEDYQLEAYLCDPDTLVPRQVPFRQVPQAITAYDVAGGDGSAFQQGALITVCVIPDDNTYSDGVRIQEIVSFDWQRDAPPVTQEAIVNGQPSSNLLTGFNPATCGIGVGVDWCTFYSILFANFYVSPGEVYGTGIANLNFLTRRRQLELDEPDSPEAALEQSEDHDARQLQEEQDLDALPFDLIVRVTSEDDGPGGLRTDGASSMGVWVTLASGLVATATLLLA